MKRSRLRETVTTRERKEGGGEGQEERRGRGEESGKRAGDGRRKKLLAVTCVTVSGREHGDHLFGRQRESPAVQRRPHLLERQSSVIIRVHGAEERQKARGLLLLVLLAGGGRGREVKLPEDLHQ